jgi:hypothetical protein
LHSQTPPHYLLLLLLLAAGGGAILMVLSPGLSGLCLGIFTILWGFTIIYGSYSRHSQRVVQVRVLLCCLGGALWCLRGLCGV